MAGTPKRILSWMATLGALTGLSCLAAGGMVPALAGDAASPADSVPQVLVFGDSLTVQSTPYITADLTDAKQARVQVVAQGGTAPCDWLSQMLRDAARKQPVAAVLLEFSGNVSCMGSPAATAGYFRAYRQQITRVTAAYTRRGAHVFIIGAPLSLGYALQKDSHWGDLNRIYSQIAATSPNTTFVNAGTAVTPNDQFTWTLPCRPHEPTCGFDGQVVVREWDGVHFCPQQPASGARCIDYSSGASRYAQAMTAPVDSFLAGNPAPAYVGDPLPPRGSVPTIARGQSESASPYLAASDFLTSGHFLFSGQSIRSVSGRYRAALERNGDFVVSGPTGAVWSSGTAGTGADVLAVQANGDVVLWSRVGGFHPVWSTDTANTRANYLGLEDSGKLALYNFNTLYWQTPG